MEKTSVGSLVYGENLLELSIEELQDGFSQKKNCKITSLSIVYLKKTCIEDLQQVIFQRTSSPHRRPAKGLHTIEDLQEVFHP